MSFRLVKDPQNTQAEELPISSQTVSVGEVLELDAGAVNWTTADASTEHWQKKAVAIEAATGSDSVVQAILVNDGQLWEADAENSSDAAHNGDRMEIASGGLTVANDGSDQSGQVACFIQRAPVGPTADAVVVGYLIAGTGVNPDAS